ncbi:unnamed protein product [Parajaminaea phylloscopi]
MPPAPIPVINIDPSDPTFVPQSLRVVELRSLLASHSIVLPSSARKADLVRAVEEHIVAPARRPPSPPPPPVAEPEPEPEPVPSPPPSAASPPQDTSLDDSANFSRHNPFQAHSPDTSSSNLVLPSPASAASSSKKARKSLGGPALSSSASPHLSAVDARNSRRKTMDPAALARRAPVQPTPARTGGRDSFSSYMDPQVAQRMLPRTPLQQSGESNNAGSTPAKSSVKHEQGTATTEQRVHNRQQALPRNPKLPRKLAIVRPRKSSNAQLAWVVISRAILLAGVIAWLWYVADSKAVGYCDHSSRGTNAILAERQRAAAMRKQSDDQSLADLLPSFATPTCTPCPPHALCDKGSLQRCESDEYLVKPSYRARLPLVRSLLPLSWQSSVCKTDSRRLEMIDELAEEVFRRVSLQAGAVLCGSAKPSKAIVEAAEAVVGAAPSLSKSEAGLRRREYVHGLLESELYAELRDLRDAESVSEAYFHHLWETALKELHESSSADGTWQVIDYDASDNGSDDSTATKSQDRILVVDRMAAAMPVACRLRLFLGSMAKAATGYILAALFLVSLGLWTRARLRRVRLEASQTDAVTNEILSRLVEQSLNATLDTELPAGLPASHLRDALLDELAPGSKSQRKRVWAAVAKRVEGNSNVRTATKRWSRSGDWMRIWEWVGVVSATPKGGSRPATPSSLAPRHRGSDGPDTTTLYTGSEAADESRSFVDGSDGTHLDEGQGSTTALEPRGMTQKRGTGHVSF